MDGKHDNRTPIEVQHCDGSADQRWIQLAGGIYFHEPSGRCIDQSAPADVGQPLVLWDCHFGWNQLFELKDGAAVSPTGLCLDIDQPTMRAQVWDCHFGANQQVVFSR